MSSWTVYSNATANGLRDALNAANVLNGDVVAIIYDSATPAFVAFVREK